MENHNAKQPADKEDINQPTENEEKGQVKKQQDDAGPSQMSELPGSVPFRVASQLAKSGLSKSEHNIRQLQPNLNLTSISFAQAQPISKSNPKEPNVQTATEETNSTFMDVKKFMASYFRGKESPLTMTEMQNTTAMESLPAPERAPVANTSCVIGNASGVTGNTSCVTGAQTEDIPLIPLTNEVIVTNTIAPADSKISKEPVNKKRNSVASEKSGFLVAQRDSLSSIGSNVCRICMTRGRERLISPCNCKGSLANVHLTCLERWLNQVGRNHCELCGFSYPAIRTPRYTVLQALRLWFGNPRNRSHLQSDCLIFWLLSTVTAGLLAVCIVGTQYFVIEGNKFGKRTDTARNEEGISHRITETAMDFFMAIVLCGYFVTVYLLCKDHYVMWNRWRRANVHVRLLLSRDTNPVPFVPRAGYNNIV